MDHFIGDVIGEMSLQLRVTFEKRQLALVRNTMKIIDLRDKAVPVLPKNFNRLHRQGAGAHVSMKPALEQPPVRQLHQVFF